MFESIISRATHIEIVTLLLAMLSASALVFWILVRRMTVQREHVALVEWGKQAGLELVAPDSSHLRGALHVLLRSVAAVEVCLANPTTRLLRVRTQTAAPAGGKLPDRESHWSIVVRALDRDWKPVGLRPSSASRSLLDFFSLSSFPMAGGAERFLLFAIDSEAAAEFPVASAQALLPHDLGLLMHGREMIIDFSDRRFDGLEFDRLVALAEQLAGRIIKSA
jgi:hypothetical protein